MVIARKGVVAYDSVSSFLDRGGVVVYGGVLSFCGLACLVLPFAPLLLWRCRWAVRVTGDNVFNRPGRFLLKVAAANGAGLNWAATAAGGAAGVEVKHHVSFLTHCFQEGLGHLFFHAVCLGQCPVVGDGDVQVEVVVKAGADDPEAVRAMP